jgi:general transcription factor 3C polypeptide 3 (transcription factor C subunit 4)
MVGNGPSGGPKSKSGSSASAATRPGRLTHAQLRELEAAKEREVMRGYKRVCELWGRMLKGASGSVGEEDQEGVREWMVEAEKMVETFRETRNLFLTSRVGGGSLGFCVCVLMRAWYRRIRLGGCFRGRR